MALAIKAENISKAYQLGEIGTGTISRDIERWFAKVRGKEDPFLKVGEANDRTIKGKSDIVWSLKDINFEIQQGDAVGIIGRNGAGKSTLLKVLSRVTTPTTGGIKVKGRIASLLEVGTGFHPELTGRENIYLNGAILGMRKKEITRKFDEIVDFSGVERYIDTPVKRYSSGMYVRLAFAVAAHLNSEILIVDEVLAVGDIDFQKKCLGKMGEVSKGEGRTVLFVSHNMEAILRLCNSAIFLQNGVLKLKGQLDNVINEYLSNGVNIYSSQFWFAENAPGNDKVKLRSVRILNENEDESYNVDITKKVCVEIKFEIFEESNNYICGLNLFSKQDVHILSSHDLINQNKFFEKGYHEVKVWLPENFLSEGTHKVSVAVMSYNPFKVHFHQLDAASFNVIDKVEGNSARGQYVYSFPGIIRPKLNWSESKKIKNLIK